MEAKYNVVIAYYPDGAENGVQQNTVHHMNWREAHSCALGASSLALLLWTEQKLHRPSGVCGPVQHMDIYMDLYQELTISIVKSNK